MYNDIMLINDWLNEYEYITFNKWTVDIFHNYRDSLLCLFVLGFLYYQLPFNR